MREYVSNKKKAPRASCSISKGVYAVLALPWFVSFSFILALFRISVEINNQQGDNSIEAISVLIILMLPIILILSLGMFRGLKKVSERLVETSKFKPVSFGTIIKLWVSYLSKLHLLWFGFYVLFGIIALIVMQFVPLNEGYHGIADQLGIPAQAGITIIFFIGLLAYMLLFGGMAYVLGTLPLALISAIIFRCFTKIQRPV